MTIALIMAAGGAGVFAFYFPIHDLRARNFRRLLCRLVGDARTPHAADGQ